MKPSAKSSHTLLLKTQAAKLGFDFCGISRAGKLDEEENLCNWLSKGYHGKMAWMENHVEKRLDPTVLVPGAKSVVSLMYNYFPGPENHSKSRYRIARYAYGKDYHDVIREKVKNLLDFLQKEIGEINGRVFVDSAPVMERQWAVRSGLGWQGKNTLLINKHKGSYFFLAELIIDLELDYDSPIGDYCGTCTRCIDACPTDAILNGKVLDASRCISYLTIELRETIPEEFEGKYADWIFGCDICQEVCPWNRFAQKHREPEFTLTEAALKLTTSGLQEITDDAFRLAFRDSPISRAKYAGIKKNLEYLSKNQQDQDKAC